MTREMAVDKINCCESHCITSKIVAEIT